LDFDFLRSERFGKVSDPNLFLIMVVLMPCLSVVAASTINQDLLLLVYLMAGLAVFAVRLKMSETFADFFFPFLLASIAMSLILSGTLISNFVPNLDIAQEFAIFQQVLQLGVWNSQANLLYNSALSVTILPSIIQIVSSIDVTQIFKIIYPSLFCIVPIMLYKTYRKMMSPAAAFLSVYVFQSFQVSYAQIANLARQMIGELLFVLLLWIIISASVRKTRGGTFLVILLTTGLMMAHYSLASVYLFLIGFSYIASRIFSKRRGGQTSFGNTSLMLVSLVTGLAWFLLAAGGIVLQTATGFFSTLVVGASDLLNPTSTGRSFLVYNAVGAGTVNFGILHLANRIIQYIVVLSIMLGFVTCLRKSSKFSKDTIVPLMAPSMSLLIASVVFPYFSGSLNFTRIYQISLLSLSPCFYFGLATIKRELEQIRIHLTSKPQRIKFGKTAAAAILFAYLIFTSGWMWAVTSDIPTSLVLDSARLANSPDNTLRFQYYNYYILAPDVMAGRWIITYSPYANLCADWTAQHGALSIAGIYEKQGSYFRGANSCPPGTYVYVSVMNSVVGVGTAPAGNVRLFGEASGHETFYLWAYNNTAASSLMAENRIYSDGATIYE